MEKINIYCNRPINEKNQCQPSKFGCGWKTNIENSSQVPSACPTCFSKDISIEKEKPWRDICALWCRQQGWSPSDGAFNVVQFLCVADRFRYYSEYMTWKSRLTDFDNLDIPQSLYQRAYQGQTTNETAANWFLEQLGLTFSSKIQKKTFLRKYIIIKNYADSFAEHFLRKALVTH